MKTQRTPRKPFFSIDVTKVAKAYRGKADKCMCGCQGRYYVASQFKKQWEDEHGYTCAPEKVNDAMIKTIVTKMNRAISEGMKVEVTDVYAAMTIGSSTYAVYWAY